jgi:acyl-CoA thioester hydrolase
MTEPDVFEFPIQVRYMEVDAQAVVFNAWYLTYFDEAFAAFVAARGLPYEKMIEAGSTARVGTTSFALDFQTRRDGIPTCTARTVYVVIGTDGSGKRPIPPLLAQALGPPASLRDP